MKKSFLTAMALIVAFFSFGQKLEKYEDVLPQILTLPASGALAQLKIYLAEDFQNPSIFLQMSLIYEGRYRNSDIMKNYAYKYGNAKEALAAFQRTKQFINEKEVSRNEEEYLNFGSYDEKGRLKVSYDSIANHMDQAIAELTGFIENAPIIYEKFTASFSHYDQAYKQFTQILGRYPTYKDLYLLYNNEVSLEFDEIKTQYDSAMIYWSQYKEALANYDIGYNQNMVIKPVEVYRLDGLEAKINFLIPEIEAWNYASWVDRTKAEIGKEITALRSSLKTENLRLDGEIASVPQNFANNTFESVKVSKEVLFNLRKYDLSAVVEPVFVYKEKKHELLYNQLLSETLDTSSSVAIGRRLYLYGQMINRIKEADTVLSELKSRNTESSNQKYEDFVSEFFVNSAGINTYADAEITLNRKDAKVYVDKIQTQLYDLLQVDSVMKYASYKRTQIPLIAQPSVANDQLTKDRLTTEVIENFDGSKFVAGIMINEKENKVQSYVSGVLKDGKVAWYNEYMLKFDSAAGFENTRIATIQSVPGGLAVILNGTDSSNMHLNHLFILDELGNVSLSKRLEFQNFPRKISYRERNNSLMIVFKGDDYIDDIFQDSELIVANYNILGDLNWQQRMNYKGNLIDVLNVDDGYILVGNYNELKGLDGIMNRAGRSNTDLMPFALRISADQGEFSLLKTLSTSSINYINQAYRISDDCINLFGSQGAYQPRFKLDTEPGSAVHYMLNEDLELLSSSLK